MSNSLRIVFGYFVIASLWIILSDEWITQLDNQIAAVDFVELSQFKGLFFVTFTSFLLYFGIKRSESRLQEKSDDFERLYRQSSTPMIIYNPANFKIRSANYAAQELYQLSEGRFIDMGFTGILSDKEFEKMKTAIHQIDSKYNYTKSWNHTKSDGTQMIVNLASHATRYKNEKVRVLAINDVTELEQQREELLRLNQELREEKFRQFALMNSLEDSIWSMTKDFVLLSSNRAFERFYEGEYRTKPQIGDELKELQNDWQSNLSEWDESIHRLINKGSTDEFIYEKDQVFRSIRPYAIWDANKKNLLAIGVIQRNITSNVKNRRQLEVQNEQLRKISSVFSHEMRRPVTTIIGLIDLIENTEDEALREESLKHLKTVSDEIDTVIRDIIGKSQSLFKNDSGTG